eukprot:COSAG02_NODE_1947_length_10299_cov_21.930294_8_plen_1407_part_00
MHFIGWKDQHDEWVSLSSGRLRSSSDGGQSEIPAPSLVVASADQIRFVRRAARRAGVALLPFIPRQEYEAEDRLLLGNFIARKSHKNRLAGIFRVSTPTSAANGQAHASASVPQMPAGTGIDVSRHTRNWTAEEMQRVKDLVKQQGPGNWDEKARQLGTGRTGHSLSQKFHGDLRHEMMNETLQNLPAGQKQHAFIKFESNHEFTRASVEDAKVIAEPRNIFRARLPADITWKTERTGWTMHAASIPAADREIFNVPDRKLIKKLAKNAGKGKIGALNYEESSYTVPTLKMAEAWSRQTRLATTCPAVLLQLAVLQSGLNQSQLRSTSAHRRQEKMEKRVRKRRLKQHERQAARDLKQVTSALDRIIGQVERLYNKGARASERSKHRSSQPKKAKKSKKPKKPKKPKKSEVAYEYVGFEQLEENMYCECLWDDEAGKDVWYRAFVRTKNEHQATVFYPESGEEETMHKKDLAPGSVRRLGAGITPPLAPWIEEENAVDEGAKAIKALPIPEREPLDSKLHELMYTVWEAVRYIGDGYGRPRAMKFLKNISRKEYPDYYEIIERPRCLDHVRKSIEAKRYKSFDEFEEDMTLIFENNREYFDQESQPFADIEVLQSIFWEALGAVESGRAYIVNETAGDFKRPKKKKTRSSKLPGSGGQSSRQQSSTEKEPCPPGVNSAMFETYQLVKNKRDKTHRLRATAFNKLPSKDDWPEYYQQITNPIDMSIIRERLLSKRYNEWQQFEDDLQLMLMNAREFNKPGSTPYEDAAVLAKLVRKCRPGEEKARLKEQEKQEAAQRREQAKAEKRQARATAQLLRKLEQQEQSTAGKVGKAAQKAEVAKAAKEAKEVKEAKRVQAAKEAALRKVPSLIEQQRMVLDTVCKLRDGDRQRAELFMALPDKVELPELPPFPPVSSTPPALAHGTVDKLVGGVLPDLAKALPTESDLRSWTNASQLAYWEQRKVFWGRSKWKLNELQRECRKRDIWPGGDLADVRHRLLRYDFCRGELLACETRTESDAQQEDSEIGILYYKIVNDPVDLNMIRERVDAGKYSTMGGMEKDLIKLFNNARKFDAHVNEPEDQLVTQDANALQAIMVRRIKEVAERTKKLLAAARSPTRSAGSSTGSKKNSKPSGAAASKRKQQPSARPAVGKQEKIRRNIASAFHKVIACHDGGRKRSELFMELPSREEYPDYYELIAEPVDLHTIGRQVDSGAFKNWRIFESKMMKVFANAKQYNLPDSQVYEDAEVMQSLLQELATEVDISSGHPEDEGRQTSEEREEAESASSGTDTSEEEESESEEEESDEDMRPPAKKRKSAAAAASPSRRRSLPQSRKKETLQEIQARIATSFQQLVNCKDGRRKRATIFVRLLCEHMTCLSAHIGKQQTWYTHVVRSLIAHGVKMLGSLICLR